MVFGTSFYVDTYRGVLITNRGRVGESSLTQNACPYCQEGDELEESQKTASFLRLWWLQSNSFLAWLHCKLNIL